MFVFFSIENKQLDRQEYNLWTVRISGEEITDDDWATIRRTKTSNNDRKYLFIIHV